VTRNNKASYEQGDLSMAAAINLWNDNSSNLKTGEEKGLVDRKGG